MRRPFVPCLVLLLLSAGGVHPAAAGVPSSATSSVEPVLVGDSSGAAIGGGFEVIARHVNGAPADPGTVITLIFPSPDIVPYSIQAAGVTVDCGTRTVSQVADLDGRAVFDARFGGFANDVAVQVRAGGVLLRNVPARSTDLNADGRTDTEDLRIFRDNFLWHRDAPETDYDLDGKTTADDLRILGSEILARAAGNLCP